MNITNKLQMSHISPVLCVSIFEYVSIAAGRIFLTSAMVKAKLSQCLIKQHNIKTYMGVGGV
jgi:hypothetical protein